MLKSMNAFNIHFRRLDSDVDRMEVRFRGDLRARLGEVRTTLVNALDKVGRSIDQIKMEVMQQQQQQARK